MKNLRPGWLLPAALAIAGTIQSRAQTMPSIPPPDARFKADILVVVAHPDDDTAMSTYLERAVLDEGKRVAVVFTTRGNSGPNAVGMEQSKALADVREMEARRSLAARGITNVWFLRGQDVPTQDVLHSLEILGHGEALEDTVRIMRLTRPEVVMTWMPAYVAGENHGDHQASAVVAVEAFDMAADAAAFGEQVTAPRQRLGIANYGEGLHPWQAKKLYFVSDATHPDFLFGHGPKYLASDLSRTKKVPFSEINRLAWEQYATQLDFNDEVLRYFINLPEYLVLGKSLVDSPQDADVWSGIDTKALSANQLTGPAPASQPAGPEPALELGGPWAFYRDFYKAHRLASMKTLVPPQSALSASRELWVPLLLRNDALVAADITLHATVPQGWTGDIKDTVYHLQPGSTYPVQLNLKAPPEVPGPYKPIPPQTLSWTATVQGKTIGTATLSAYLEYNYVPQ